MISAAPRISQPVYLEKNFAFYRELPAAGKEKFLKRLLRFVSEKDFVGRGNLVVTTEMKWLVCAAAVQLTYGLEEYLLPTFHTIILYPDIYFSPVDGYYHKGETNSKGMVVFSWKHFVEGYKVPHDKLNLGLHEWSHALMLENQFGYGRDELFREYFNRWRFEAMEQFANIRAGYSDVFREYGSVNMAEFFAVAVEVFFEAPEQFKERVPVLFRHMCILLNQFPLGEIEAAEVPERDETITEVQAIPAPETLIIERLSLLGKPFRYSSYYLLSVGLAAASLVLATVNKSPFLPLVFLCMVLLRYGRKRWLSWSSELSLKAYEGYLLILDRNGNALSRFIYEHLASLEIVEHDDFYRLFFVYPVHGQIHAEGFRLRFDEKQILSLRDLMREKHIPVIRRDYLG